MNVLELFKPITTFFFDVDGVLTDGTVLVLDGGLQARRMSIKDGFALQMAVNKGYRVVIVSGGHSPQVADRLSRLGISEVHMSVSDKKEFILNYCAENKLRKENLLYMADDLPDLSAMEVVGLSCCPADAVSEIRDAVKYISPFKGGETCVRDVIEKVLKLNGHWSMADNIASR